jgi:uncharacterized membrane protein YfcA
MSINSKVKNVIILPLVGIAAGAVNGLVGSGAGIVLIYALRLLYPKRAERELFALSLSTVFFITLSSALFYGADGRYRLTDFMPYALPAALGGFVGSLVLARINTAVLKKVFCGILIISGFLMLR